MRVRWQISTIERAGFSTQSAVAFSPTGGAAVAYYSSVNNALRFAMETDSALWDISTVETMPSDCKPSLAFRFGQPAISYRVGPGDGPGELKYATYSSGIWSTEPVASDADVSSLAFDASHRPAISYYDSSSKKLKLARSTGPSTWVTETAAEPGGVVDFNSLSFVPSTAPTFADRPAIAYHDRSYGSVVYAMLASNGWFALRVGDLGTVPGLGRCSLAHSPTGIPVIVVGALGAVQKYSNDSSFGWYFQGISGARTGSIAYNPARIYERGMSYDFDGSVRYSIGYGIGRLLVEAPGKTQSGALIGPFELTSTAFSAAGRPAISYYDISNNTIKVALGTIVRMPLDYVADFVEQLLRTLRSRSDEAN
jgi:hypothetical protein